MSAMTQSPDATPASPDTADLEVVTDRSDRAVQRLVDLMKPARAAVKSVVVEDEEPLAEALAAGVEVAEVYGLESSGVPASIRDACAERDVPVRLLGTTLAGQVFKGAKKPKVFGVARVPAPARLRDLHGTRGDVVVLDGVRIVGNIGAIVRTCFALGAGGLVLVDSALTTVADRRLIRASRGYVFSFPVILADAEQVVGYLGESGLPLVTVDAEGDRDVTALVDIDERIALLLGSEKTGSSDALARHGREAASIAMNPAAESLNVSVATGIALHARARRNL